MKRNILVVAACTALFLTSCKKEKSTVFKNMMANTDTISKSSDSTAVSDKKDDLVKSTATDSNGQKLDMKFNNTKDTATLIFNGETIELAGQKPASGIWYKNDHYELRGKGESVELSKDGKVVFKK
ncbi:membrane-bound inhibitor of C-type lysozyme [Chryseobacterium sp. H1D6B]|uniref:MliC family protein n=1 Tax=Chryseobacterium sp. H1D6B TaxID=2940588 RepID=UPI0015CA8ECB|nr:MliC family protein [Chryseobacterium sp. H1D6B]MDH6250668.1 membrane-bound inhibitor of C-type lysozyme [Chryseobacterium sp. H1D6B]